MMMEIKTRVSCYGTPLLPPPHMVSLCESFIRALHIRILYSSSYT